MAGRHLIKDCSERIDIRARIDCLARLRLLGSHVFHGAEDIAAHGNRGFFIFAALFCQAEVGNQRFAIATQENVSRLEIAVEHSVRVCEFHRLADLLHDPQCLIHRENHRRAGARRLFRDFGLRLLFALAR